MTADTPSPSEVDLLPCPFCGGSVQEAPPMDDGTGVCWHVENGCILSGLWFPITKWNARASSPRSSTVDEATVEAVVRVREFMAAFIPGGVVPGSWPNDHWIARMDGPEKLRVNDVLALLKFTEAAIASLPSATVGWQPIETAPKDGTRLLLWDTFSVFEGLYNGSAGWATIGLSSRAWVSCWQPLPEPPASLPSVAVQPIGER